MNNTTIPTQITDYTIELMQAKHFNKISIMEITKTVNISRVTFYNYFQNKEDILDALVENLLIEFDHIQKKNIPFLEQVDLKETEAIKQILYPNTREILSFFYENRMYITALLSEHSPINFMDILHSTYYNHFLNALPELFSVKFGETTIKSYATYMTTGVKALIEEWFLNDFDPSIEIVSQRILNMLSPSLKELYIRKI